MAKPYNKNLTSSSSSSYPVIPSGPGESSAPGGSSGGGASGTGERTSNSKYTCRKCAEQFGSQNAVNAHMRKHTKRDGRGASRPSKGEVPDTRDQPVPPEDPNVLRAAQTLLLMRNGVCSESSHSVRVTNVDLNKEPEEAAGGCSPPPHGGE